MNAAVEKARRTWRVNKADMEAQVIASAQFAEARAEMIVNLRRLLDQSMATSKWWEVECSAAHTRADHWKERAMLWRRLALSACAAFLVLAGWGWPW